MNKNLLYTQFDLDGPKPRCGHGQVKYSDIQVGTHSKYLLKAYHEKFPRRKVNGSLSDKGYVEYHWTENIKNIWSEHLLKAKGSDYEKIRAEYNKAFIPGISSSLVMKRVNNMLDQLDTKYTLQKHVINFVYCLQ